MSYDFDLLCDGDGDSDGDGDRDSNSDRVGDRDAETVSGQSLISVETLSLRITN